MSFQSICSRSMVQFQCFFIDFLCGWSINGWQWDIEKLLLLLYCFSPLGVSVCLIYFGAPTLSAYIFTIVISSWLEYKDLWQLFSSPIRLIHYSLEVKFLKVFILFTFSLQFALHGDFFIREGVLYQFITRLFFLFLFLRGEVV